MSGRFAFEVPVLALVCTAAGLAAGWWVAIDRSGAATPAEDESAAGPGAKVLSAATLQNLNVSVAPIAAGSFSRTVPIAAVVAATPLTDQPVFAPVGGRVRSVDVVVGDFLREGDAVATLLREPIPPPVLTLTGDVLRPGQENLHEAVHQLHLSSQEVEIVRTELERVESYSGALDNELPLLPGQRAIDLRQQLQRAEHVLEETVHELRKHGFDDDQIEKIREGEALPTIGPGQWMRALSRNGLWPEVADRLYATLPESQRDLPWVIATIAELGAAGLVESALVDWFESEPSVSPHFLQIGAMLQRGHSIADLRVQQAQNAFEPLCDVNVPPHAGGSSSSSADPFDVREVRVKVGETVAAGAVLVILRDHLALQLRVEPVGAEIVALLGARRQGLRCTARSLVVNAGPVLTDLPIERIVDAANDHGTEAWIPIRNAVLPDEALSDEALSDEALSDEALRNGGLGGEGAREERHARVWSLREGMRYVLHVPVDQRDGVFVLPSSAVTSRGPDRIVFLQNGDHFDAVPIVVLHEDQDVVVVPATGRTTLFEGDPIVMTGAFELGLALRADAGNADAGHGHSH